MTTQNHKPTLQDILRERLAHTGPGSVMTLTVATYILPNGQPAMRISDAGYNSHTFIVIGNDLRNLEERAGV